MAWKMYTDATCTTPFGGTLSFTHLSDLSDNPQDRVLYYANIDDDPMDAGTYQLRLQGGGNINVTITDASPGTGHEATEIKLAASSAGLDTASAGAALSLGTSLTSGLSGAREIHIRVTNAVTTASVSTELAIQTPEAVIVVA